MSGIMKGLGKILPIVLGAAAIIFTAGAAIPAIGAVLGSTLGLSAATVAGGFSGVVGSALADVGLTGTIGDVIGGAVAASGIGAAAGGALAAVTGKNIVSGMASGAETGALAGGVGGALGLTSVASGAASRAADLGGAAGDGMTSDLNLATADGGGTAASSGAAGAVTPAMGGVQIGAGTSYSPTGGFEAASGADTTAGSGVASSGAAGSTAAANSVTGMPVAADAPSATPQGGGLLSNLFSKGGALGNGGLGQVISGVGQGLGTAQAAQDQVKGQQALQTSAAAITKNNYDGSAGSSGFMLTPAKQPNGLPSPAQAFNPTSRWVYDPTQQRLVLIPGSNTASGVTASVPNT